MSVDVLGDRKAGAADRRAPKADELRVLYWHWGRYGAGAKFTFEVVRGTLEAGGARAFVSAVEDCELAELMRREAPDIPLCEIRTFSGAKENLGGKLAAVAGLLRLGRIGRDLEAFLRQHRIDVAVCTFFSIWDLALLPVLRRLNIPFVLVAHDVEPHPGDSYPFRRRTMRHEVRAADAVIVLSDHVREQALRVRGRPGETIEIIPHGAFEFGAEALRSAPVGRPARLLFFGRILAYKGVGLLLDACRVLQAQGFPVDLDIMGSGDMRPYAGKLDGLRGVRVTNRWMDESEIGGALAAADIVVLPYLEASQSGVAASAATAGVPCVATPVGGLTAQVLDGRTGLVAAAVTPESLAASIYQLATEPDLYERCSAGALDHAREALAWSAIGQRVLDVARAALAQKGRPA